jgi:hypothetical protein
MPLLKIRTVSIVLILALAVLCVPLGITLHELAQGADGSAWLRLFALLTAFVAVGFSLYRQRSVRALLAERQRVFSRLPPTP